MKRNDKDILYVRYISNPVVLAMLLLSVVIVSQDAFSPFIDTHSAEIFDFEFNFSINTLFPVFTLPFFLSSKELDEFVNSFLFWSILYLLIVVFAFNLDVHEIAIDRTLLEEATDSFVSTIPLSRYAGIAAIVSLSFFLFQDNNKLRTISIFSFLFSSFVLLVAGQRGSLIGFIIAFVFLCFKSESRFRIHLTIFAVLAVLLMISLFDFGIFNRMEQLKGYQQFDRYNDYFKVWSIFEKNNYLWGLGAKGYFFETGRSYPHNIILEHIVNYGILGLLSILTILVSCVKYCLFFLRKKDCFAEVTICACWLLLAFSVMVSGGMNGNKIFYLFSALLAFSYLNEVATPENC
ncbi:MAG: hypothetical protein IJM58_02475 [Muribaculaceae bacterium]|nr:hypothetical protein [Muribaculaceae bacterium]